MTTRDPRIDPEEGDFVAVRGFTFTVLGIQPEDGDVYVCRGEPGGIDGYAFIPLDKWRRDLAEVSK